VVAVRGAHLLLATGLVNRRRQLRHVGDLFSNGAAIGLRRAVERPLQFVNEILDPGNFDASRA